MKVRLNADSLLKVLKKVEAVADKKASMAVLSMTLLEPNREESSLYLTATDLEIGYKGKVFAEFEDEGESFCVPAKKFYEIVKNFPEEELFLTKEENRLVIKDPQERIVYNLAVISSEEFPSLPEFTELEGVEIPGNILHELIDKTIFATSKEEANFVLGGIYFEPFKEEGKLRAVASDGHRLAYLEREIPDAENLFETGFIVARKAAKQIEDIAKEELSVKFAFLNNYAVLKTLNSIFFSRTIEGEFPDYKEVIPQDSSNILKVDRKLFMDALKRASLLISEKFKPVTLNLRTGEIVITSQESEMGKAEVKLEAEYEGEELSINYNAQYLIDALEIMKSEEVELKIGNEQTPTVITGFRDEGFLYLLMPMVI